jgi:hypothetical protein
LSDATEPMLQATIVRGLWRKQGTVGTTHLCLRSRADRSWEIPVSAGSQGDLARDSEFASPAGWTLPKSPSEEPA